MAHGIALRPRPFRNFPSPQPPDALFPPRSRLRPRAPAPRPRCGASSVPTRAGGACRTASSRWPARSTAASRTGRSWSATPRWRRCAWRPSSRAWYARYRHATSVDATTPCSPSLPEGQGQPTSPPLGPLARADRPFFPLFFAGQVRHYNPGWGTKAPPPPRNPVESFVRGDWAWKVCLTHLSDY